MKFIPTDPIWTKTLAASLPDLQIWVINQEMPNQKTETHSQSKFWNRHGDNEGFVIQATIDLELDLNTKKWDETYRDAVATSNPS